MKFSGIYDRLKNAFGIVETKKFPREILMRKFDKDGCKFEISAPIEVFRIQEYGGEQEFTGLILESIKTGDVFFDIGACVGLVSVHAAKKGARVYAFEPDPYYRSRLNTNLRLNGLNNVQVIEWAVSDVEGEVALFTDGEEGNSPSLRNIGDRGAITVKTDFIENALQRGEIPRPDIVKLDIEGAEILALRGMQGLLSSENSPRAIFMEIHPNFLNYFGASTVDIEELMSKSGYILDYKTERSNEVHCIFKKSTSLTGFVVKYSENELLNQYVFKSRNKVLVDVGGHHGSFSLSFARKGWRIIAFEPEENNRHAYESNLARFSKVSCLSSAVSDVDGEKVPFYVSKEHYGIHSLRPFHPTHQLAYEVETVRLDTVLEQHAIKEVTLLKIDTEGADFLALKSLDFNKYKPEMVIVEFMDERSMANYGYTHHDMVRFMSELNYVAFVSEWAPIKEYGREGVPGEPHTWLQCVPYPLDHEPAWGNLIFVPESDKARFTETMERYLVSLNTPEESALRKFVMKIPGAIKAYRYFSGMSDTQ